MAQRHPDGAGAVVGVGDGDRPERGVHRGLGDAVHVDQPRRTRMAVQPCPEALRFKGFAAEDHGLEGELSCDVGLQRVGGLQRIERGRGLAEHADSFGDQQGVQVFRGARRRLGHHHQSAAGQQRAEHLPHRVVKRQRMALRPHPGPRHVGIQRLQQPGHVLVSDRYAFGHPGGARRVDDVGDVVAGWRRQHRGRLGVKTMIADVDDRPVKAR
ncbi:hypothetical protein C1Y40_05043 [Mycobacterium talmoniae]|uniref:Uncharacterized protein n=1 Tax=Mycobacterium talmoniae TaxID=1858794 RepID=A0A2S8BDP7_9MYCO|nr:hypothetical protein C1Y40_05043 [Mycobacterium talmoniae]